jgi:glutathione S-transferase
MKTNAPIRLFGNYGSPYTQKMLSLMRFRQIPYQMFTGLPGDATKGLPKPKVELIPTFYLKNAEGDLEAVVDSTPIIRRFDDEIIERQVIPKDPAIKFVDYLLEDYADEWLTKAMFHFRWHHKADRDNAAAILPLEPNPSLREKDYKMLGENLRDRQVSRLHVVGSNDITAEVIEKSYERFLQAFEGMLEQRSFLMGSRPGAADFAIYGQLTQLASFDPTPTKLTLEKAPRVYAWVHYMEDLSGLDVDGKDWFERDDLLQTLQPLLKEVGRSYVPVMLANAKALANKEAIVRTTVEGKAWEQQAFPYQGRCIYWVREQYLALENADRQWVDSLFEGTGCERLLLD